MKTWNEIEAGLKAEPGVEPPAGLHDRILRAVRDDRAATARTTAPRHYVSLWLMAGATVAALGAMTSVLLFSPAPPAPERAMPAAPGTPAISFARLEALATRPMRNEYENLQADIASAARFIAASLPSGASGS